VRAAVGEYARASGVSRRVVERVELAVSELVTNAMIHGYSGRHGTITVRADVDDQLVIVVTDHGQGFGPRDDSPGLGLGLPLVTRLATTLEVGAPAEGSGTVIRLTFPLPEAA
jgi:serine/threonine-protein kinase RsbW/stage II sporulation protein AB (anti-sigma F factor)